MSELSGCEVIKILSQNPSTETIPLVLLLAKTSATQIHEGMNLSADDYFTKPVSGKDLIRTIRTICKVENILNSVAIEKVKQYNRENDLVISIQPSTINFSESNFKIDCQEITDNALKYSDKGTTIHIIGISLNNEYVISVMDNGSGMNENQIASIGNFMQFERTKFEQQRAGLGLTISRKLVEFYCGKFKIESVPRKQTIVRITLNRTNNTI